MRENEKYVQSISGHIAQLQNAWQEMWANAANRDVINFFIDAAKAVVNFVNAIGLIPSTLVLSLPFLEMISKAKSGKGLVTSFLEWANGLNEIKKLTEELGEAEVASDVASTASSAMKTAANQAETASALEQAEAYEDVNYTEALESATDLEGTITSTAKSAANMGEKLSETGEAATGTSNKLTLLKGAFTGLKKAIGLPTLGLIGFVAACAIAKKAYDAYNEARFNEAKEATDSIKQQQDSMSARIESYKELKAQLDSGDLSEQETIETKQKILDIQKEIANQYGSAAKGVDLVNGKLEQQVGILNSITEKEAGKQYASNRKGFDVAAKEYGKVRPFTIDLEQSSNKELNNQMKDALSKAGLQSYGELGNKSLLFKNATDTAEALEKARDSLEELKKEYRDPKDIKAIDDQIEEIDTQITKAYEVIDKYEETALKGMELELARNKRTGYDAFQNYQTSTADLESAYASGNTKKIEEARKAFEEAKKAKDDFLSDDGNAQFASLFDTIDTSFVEAKNQYHDVVESFKDIPEPKDLPTLFEEDGRKILKGNTDALKKEKGALDKAHKAAEKLYKLNPDRVDIEGTLLDNAYAGGVYADALNDLINELGWSTDNTDDLINALIDAGIIQGNAADIADYASNSYNNFASSIDDAIVSIGALNTALAESASGKGITDPNLEAFRKAFGEDGLKILEKTANGYHLNVEGAYLLRNAQDALVKANYASALNEQYTALDKLQEGYQKALLAGEDTTGFVQQRQAIQNNIDKINEELMAYQNANSAYQTWLANQNSEGEREMYNSVYSGYDAVKDELDRGFAGPKSRSWLDLVFNDEGEEDFDVWTASAEELRDRFKEIKKDIEGTGGYSIADFFTVDKNGKSTSQGIWNFFEAIENKQDEVGQKFVDLENMEFNFGENGDQQIADLLGMDVESVQAILRAAADADFEIHLDQPLFSMEQLEEKANSAKESLEEITGKKLNIDLDPSSVEEADESMALLSEYQQSIAESGAIEPKVKTQMLESVASLMEYIVAQKKELLEDNLLVFRVDNTEIDKSKDEITDVYNKLQTYTKKIGNIDLSEAFTIDPMRINDIEYLTELQKEIFDATQTLDVDSTQVEYLKQLLVEIKEHIDLLNSTNIGVDGKITVNDLMAAEQVVNDINTKLDYASQRKINIDWSADEEFVKELDTLANLPEEAKIALNIPTDANGEQLLELAQQGELHIGVTVDGDIPQDTTQTNVINNQENNEVNFSSSGAEAVAEEAGKIKTYTDELTGEEHVINYSSNADVETEKANTLIEKGKKFGEDIYEGTAKLQDSQAVQAFLNLFSDADKWDVTDVTGDAHLDDHGASNLLSSIIHDTHTFEGDHYAHYYIKVHGTIPTGGGKGAFDGTAHANGTAFYKGNIISGNAFKGGNWGVSKTQEALVGELGTEIMVTPNGQWQTIGEGGAEFTRIPKGSIIFNHKQSEELLKNGHVTSNRGRGSLVGFANGTAYSWGTGKGAIKPSSSSTGMGGSTTSNSNRGGGSHGGNNGSNNKGNNNKSSEKAKETKNTLDEVEILIARIERQISRLDTRIGDTYSTWKKRNVQVRRSLSKVSQELKDQQGAYDTYIKKAKEINLPQKWSEIIHKGNLDIEEIKEKVKESTDNGEQVETLWDKITKYRDYYEKALSAKDKILELQQKEGELYKTLFDNEQAYYESVIANTQHVIDLNESYIDKLNEAGRLSSKTLLSTQSYKEKQRLRELNKEYDILKKRRDEAVESGKIKKYSEAWYEMQQTLNDVSLSIEEAEKNVIAFANAMREVDWTRWEKTHDTISSFVDELEFMHDLIYEEDMFDEKGDITNYGITSYALLAQQYDTYMAEANKYREEIQSVQDQLLGNPEKKIKGDPNNTILIDKLKDLRDAYQDATAGAKKATDAMRDQTEKGFKIQIDYVKELIDDYEKLLDAQKDQTDYAKKVSDQQKEINKLEKQYRAVQNDTSEEGAARRQRLREQIKEKKQGLKDTQEDRRISETKDMLSEFSESLEDYFDKKIKERENINKGNFALVNDNIGAIQNVIKELQQKTGYYASDLLNNSINSFKESFVNYFAKGYDSEIAQNTGTIINGINQIIARYDKIQANSDRKAKQEQIATKVRETKNHIQTYRDDKGNVKQGYFRNDGSLNKSFTGWANQGTNYVKNGKPVANAWQTIDGKKYYFNKSGTKVTGSKSIGDKKYYFGEDGTMLTGWRKVGGKLHYYNPYMYTGKVTIGKNKYTFDENGVLVKEGWKKGTPAVPTTGYAWTNEGHKAEAIVRKSDGAILTPLNRGDSVIPNSAMKNLYQALTDPAKYLKQYTTPDVRIIQSSDNMKNSSPANVNMQIVVNGVQDANKFANDLMNNKKLEKWIQEVTLGQANGNNSYRKYNYTVR